MSKTLKTYVGMALIGFAVGLIATGVLEAVIAAVSLCIGIRLVKAGI